MTATEAQIRVNGVTLHTHAAGAGDPLILVHGSLADHTSWHQVAPELAASFYVVVYDRRGHSRSQRTDGPRSVHEDDLAALIEALDLAPAHLAGNSYGASIALAVASRRPELVRSVIAHEPPLLAVGQRNPALAPQMRAVQALLDGVADQLRTGDTSAGAARFIEEITLGPGTWEQLPAQLRQTMVDNAPTFLETMNDPHWADLAVQALSRASCPILLTNGEHSPPWFGPLMTELTRLLAQAERHTFQGAGHVPAITHPVQYVDTIRSFIP